MKQTSFAMLAEPGKKPHSRREQFLADPGSEDALLLRAVHARLCAAGSVR